MQTKDDDGCAGPVETLIVLRTLDQEKRTSYHLSNAPATAKLWQLVYVGSRRHDIEEVFQEAKGEVGLGHYEARSWVGWHHHMTLSLLALWFLTLERRRVGEKNPDHDGAPDWRGLPFPTATNASQLRQDRQGRQQSPPPHHRGPHLSLLRRYQAVPPATRERI